MFNRPACAAAFCIIFLALCAPAAFSGPMYTAHNIWYEAGKEMNIPSTHYKKGVMIPAGTKVAEAVLTTGRRTYIDFKTAKDGKAFRIQFTGRRHPGVTPMEYAERLFTARHFDDITAGMTQEEISAIRNGKLVVGMSKPAVIMSYGYPPEHATYSLDANIWIFWLDRFRTKQIRFDENGRTIKQEVAAANEL